jgi:thymidine kinase
MEVILKMKLTLVTGPMFAGKTSYLMSAIRDADSKRVIVATHASDTRFTNR